MERKRDQRWIVVWQRRQKKVSEGEKKEFKVDWLYDGGRIWEIGVLVRKVYDIKFNGMLLKKGQDLLDEFGEGCVKFENEVIMGDKYVIRELEWEVWKGVCDYKIRNKYGQLMRNRKVD